MASSGSTTNRLSTVDISTPGQMHDYMVWRNGRFYKISVHLREYETLVNGKSASPRRVAATDDPADFAAQTGTLPPRNPAFDGVNPTPQQMADMEVAMGNNPDGSPGPAMTAKANASYAQAVAAAGGLAAYSQKYP